MTVLKTLQVRERELRDSFQTPTGPAELEALADTHAIASATPRPRTSVITYILVYERCHGLLLP
jgi:hypothetical protein